MKRFQGQNQKRFSANTAFEIFDDCKHSANASNSESISEESEGVENLFPIAVNVVLEAGQASTSLLQRRLRLGYSRAGKLLDMLEERGIVGPHEEARPHRILITKAQWKASMEMQNFTQDSVGSYKGPSPREILISRAQSEPILNADPKVTSDIETQDDVDSGIPDDQIEVPNYDSQISDKPSLHSSCKNRVKKRKGRLPLSIAAFLIVFVAIHSCASNIWEVDENNVLQAPGWYALFLLGASVLAGILTYKLYGTKKMRNASDAPVKTLRSNKPKRKKRGKNSIY